MRRKFTEANIPTHLRAQVRYDRGERFVTYCALVHKESMGIAATGFAVCSVKDQPCKKRGRAIAVGRALSDYYHGERKVSDVNSTTETN